MSVGLSSSTFGRAKVFPNAVRSDSKDAFSPRAAGAASQRDGAGHFYAAAAAAATLAAPTIVCGRLCSCSRQVGRLVALPQLYRLSRTGDAGSELRRPASSRADGAQLAAILLRGAATQADHANASKCLFVRLSGHLQKLALQSAASDALQLPLRSAHTLAAQSNRRVVSLSARRTAPPALPPPPPPKSLVSTSALFDNQSAARTSAFDRQRRP